jgi:carboxypeptidase Q
MSRTALLLLAMLPLVGQDPNPATYQGLYRSAPFKGEGAELLKEVKEHQEAYRNLEDLCDLIGPRLTGSPQMFKAADWAEAKMKAYGATNVHQERYAFGPSWTRGRDYARLTTHNGLLLRVDQMAWTPATQGTVKGEVVLFGGDSLEEMTSSLKGKMKGKIVLIGKMPRPKEGQDRKAFRAAVDELFDAIEKDGALALLMPSEKKDGHLNMSGSPKKDEGIGITVPTAFVAPEHAGLLKRLLARHEPVEMELALTGTFSPKPVEAVNVIGEIRGSEKPDEMVIVGGHFDSWDLGTGATDNGTGTVVTLEVLRAIQKAGLKPKRTIRFVLWSGEEQGLLGSHAYVKAHKDELKHIQAVLVHDLGTGKVKGWTLQGREDCLPGMAAALAPANGVGGKELLEFALNGSDHNSFEPLGVPAFFAHQEQADYFTSTHHSQTDTFEHVVPEDLTQGAQVVAVTAYGLANLPQRLPHQAK